MWGFYEPSSPEVLHFRMQDGKCILKPQHLALANGAITVGTPYTHAFSLDTLNAPPYASPDFKFDIRLFGEEVYANHWVWYPNMVFREGTAGPLEVSSVTALGEKSRRAVMRVKLRNTAAEAVRVPWTVHVGGVIDYVHDWAFGYPKTNKRGSLQVESNSLFIKNSCKAYAVTTSLPDMTWFSCAGLWECTQLIPAGETVQVDFSFQMGSPEYCREAMAQDCEACLQSACRDLENKVSGIFASLPTLTAVDPKLEAFYYRSLVSLLLNKWEAEEFALRPYFSTGGIKGGCMASYLWDFSAGDKILALYDPQATKAQIKAYFDIDIFKSYAFLPVSGNATGPWYPVNQEKIVDMVYQFVLQTGDVAFLEETVAGKTVIEWMEENAFFGCVDGKAELIDYGADGEDHLELRRGYPYRGIMPDLNARRYATFRKAAALCELCGRPAEKLLRCAEELKALVRSELWDADTKWMPFLVGGKKDYRYTVQMFKCCDSGVLSDEMLDGLLSHLNEKEFLSPYGLHSMSKLDPAYDQVDIDNGGGGICTIFPILIAEKLYRIGRYTEADDILRRILWWGERMPFWGDSFVANYVDYRQDTPLQCTIGSIAGAQFVLFGIFGISAQADGTVSVCPHLPAFGSSMTLHNIRLHGHVFTVCLAADGYTVTEGDKERTAPYGESILL